MYQYEIVSRHKQTEQWHTTFSRMDDPSSTCVAVALPSPQATTGKPQANHRQTTCSNQSDEPIHTSIQLFGPPMKCNDAMIRSWKKKKFSGHVRVNVSGFCDGRSHPSFDSSIQPTKYRQWSTYDGYGGYGYPSPGCRGQSGGNNNINEMRHCALRSAIIPLDSTR